MVTDENRCSVCLKHFHDPRRMPCRHIYCFKCIPKLRCRERTIEKKLVLQCFVCAMKFIYPNWSTLKYNVTLNCVPYLTAKNFQPTNIVESICPICFQRNCFDDHQNELKKKILRVDRQCQQILRRNYQNIRQLKEQLFKLKHHLDRSSWTIECSIEVNHLAFDSNSSKLFVCSSRGSFSIYDEHRSLIKRSSIDSTIQSITVSPRSFIIVVLQSKIQSILHFYSHQGQYERSIPFVHRYITQIRYHTDQLWILELTSSSIVVFPHLSTNENLDEKILFVTFENRQTFDPFRFDLNHFIVAVLDRNPTGLVRLFHRTTSNFIKQIDCRSNDVQPCDFILTDVLLIFRFAEKISLIDFEKSQCENEFELNEKFSSAISQTPNALLLSTYPRDRRCFTIEYLTI